MKYQVRITELCDKIVMVSANTESEAVQLVRQMYEDKEIKMGVDDFIDVDFNSHNIVNSFKVFLVTLSETISNLFTFLQMKKNRCLNQGRSIMQKKFALIQVILKDRF